MADDDVGLFFGVLVAGCSFGNSKEERASLSSAVANGGFVDTDNLFFVAVPVPEDVPVSGSGFLIFLQDQIKHALASLTDQPKGDNRTYSTLVPRN